MYVIMNSKGYYYSKTAGYTKSSWTRDISKAKKYDSREQAKNNSCQDNETVHNIYDLIR